MPSVRQALIKNMSVHIFLEKLNDKLRDMFSGGAGVILSAVAGSLLLMTIVLVLLSHSYHRVQASAYRNADNLTRLIAQDVESRFLTIDQALLSMVGEYATLDLLQDERAVQWLEHIRSVHPLLKENLRVADVEGTVVLGPGVRPGKKTTMADREYFIRHREDPGAGLLISGPFSGRMTGTMVMVLSRRLNDRSGKFIGVVFAPLPVDQIRSAARTLALGPDDIIIVRSSGFMTIFRQPPYPGNNAGSSFLTRAFENALKKDPEQGRYTTQTGGVLAAIDKIPRLFSYRHDPRFGFYVNVGLGRDDVFAQWGRDALVTLTVSFLFSIGLLFLAWRMQHNWKRLTAAEEKYRRLHESMAEAFVRVDMAGRILEYNHAYRDMLGYSDAEVLQLTYMDITPVRWRAMEDQIVKTQILVRGYSDVYEKEYQRKDGTVFPVEVRSFLFKGRGRQPDQLCAIVRDITGRKQAEEALMKAKDAAESASKAKTDFLNNIAHDFRTPLHALIGFGYLLQKEALDEKQKKFVAIINENGQNLLKLVEDLLDVSRLEAGRISLQPVEFDLKECVNSAFDMVNTTLFEKNVKMSCSMEEDFPLLKGDPVRLGPERRGSHTRRLRRAHDSLYRQRAGDAAVGDARRDSSAALYSSCA